MAYNYSRSFLLQNHIMVESLRSLVKSDQVICVEVDSVEKARKFQLFVRNIAASLAIYETENTKVFNSIRTWVDHTKGGESWRVFVGLPKHKLRGFPPNTTLGQLSNEMMYKIAATTPAGDLEEYPTTVSDETDAMRLLDHCMKTKYRQIKVQFPGPVHDAPFWNAFRNAGWSLTIDHSTVVFTRNADAAADNL